MVKKFFIICSGTDRELIATCSNGEQNKYAGIGATVFFTALMAFIASAYAIFTVFKEVYSALFFGVLWGFLIFNLDRFIVSTIKKRDRFRKEFIQAIPRIVLAIIIAIVISKPLEIKIFEKEINTVLLKEKQNKILENKKNVLGYFVDDIRKLQLLKDSLYKGILDKEKEVNELYSVYIAEAEGKEGTKKIGKGPVYKEKREKHDQALKDYNLLKNKNNHLIENIDNEIKGLEEKKNGKVVETEKIVEDFDGLMARINALGKLPFMPSFFIMLLFIVVELTPILVKLMSSKGEYDFKLDMQEFNLLKVLEQNKYQEEKYFETSKLHHDNVYKNLDKDEELIKKCKEDVKEIIRFQSESFSQKKRK